MHMPAHGLSMSACMPMHSPGIIEIRAETALVERDLDARHACAAQCSGGRVREFMQEDREKLEGLESDRAPEEEDREKEASHRKDIELLFLVATREREGRCHVAERRSSCVPFFC